MHTRVCATSRVQRPSFDAGPLRFFVSHQPSSSLSPSPSLPISFSAENGHTFTTTLRHTFEMLDLRQGKGREETVPERRNR